MCSTPHRVVLLSILCFGLLISACQRPFVEVAPPSIEIIQPDFSQVFVTSSTVVRLSASSFRAVERVTIDGEPMSFDADAGVWEDTLRFHQGLNTFVIESFDTEEVSSVDTVFAVFMPYSTTPVAPSLPVPRGGHAMTLLTNRTRLATGGSAVLNGPAENDAFILPVNGRAFSRLPATLHRARAGHTATLLPDERVLIAGGSITDGVQDVDDLVETVEIYNHEARTFKTIPVEGVAIRRAMHTASVRSGPSGPIIDLVGGRGDIRYTPTPRLGIREDVRSFLLRNDSLIALNAPRTAPALTAIAGHTQTPLTNLSSGEAGTYLVAGSFFGEGSSDDVSFKLDFDSPTPSGIGIEHTPTLNTPRTRHAAELLRPEMILFFGGRQDLPNQVADDIELYVAEANRYFTFPAVSDLGLRFGHTATKSSSARILLVGGFSSNGNALSGSEFFTIIQ